MAFCVTPIKTFCAYAWWQVPGHSFLHENLISLCTKFIITTQWIALKFPVTAVIQSVLQIWFTAHLTNSALKIEVLLFLLVYEAHKSYMADSPVRKNKKVFRILQYNKSTISSPVLHTWTDRTNLLEGIVSLHWKRRSLRDKYNLK